jgi:hypothetical protein
MICEFHENFTWHGSLQEIMRQKLQVADNGTVFSANFQIRTSRCDLKKKKNKSMHRDLGKIGKYKPENSWNIP